MKVLVKHFWSEQGFGVIVGFVELVLPDCTLVNLK